MSKGAEVTKVEIQLDKPPREAPISLRLKPELRNSVAAYAAENEIAFNAAVVRLLESALGGPDSGGSARHQSAAPAEPAAKPKKRAARPKQEAEPVPKASTASGLCPHRVPLTSFCSRCAGIAL